MTSRKTRVIVPATTEPITLEEAKNHLRVDLDFLDDDAYITGLISVARDYAEGFQKKSLVPCTLELIQDYFTCPIYLELGPVKTVTSVKYRREDGTEATISATDYIVTVDGKIVPKTYWPIDTLAKADAIRVVYETGTPTVPPATKQGMLLLIGHWYEFREPVLTGKTMANLPFSAKQLLHMGKDW